MTGGRTDRQSVRAGTTGEEAAEPFRMVLDAEKRWLADVTRAEELTGWRSRVIREVMDRGSPYAKALRRHHGACRQSEFLQDWRSLITSALERIGPSEAATPGGATTVPAATTRTEDVATAILAALHGGATLSWLADDPRSLEAALDIALASVLPSRAASGPGHRPPR